MPRKKLTYKDFINYFKNSLQKKEKHDFEKDMMRDAFEEEAFDGLSKLNAAELEEDLKQLKSNVSNKTQKTRRLIPIWIRYAASVLVLVGIGFTIVFLNSRYWQDSMIKEQVAKEMDIADSMIVESGNQLKKEAMKNDTILDKSDQYIAENRELEKNEDDKIEAAKEMLVEDEMELADAYVSEDDKSSENEVSEVVQLEDQAELVEKSISMEAPARAKTAVAAMEKKEEQRELDNENFAVSEAVAGNVEEKEIHAASRVRKSSAKDEKAIIKGKIVSSEEESSLPGVSITLKDDPNIGTTTNVDGAFQLALPHSDDELKTLIASFVGMRSQEIEIERDTSVLVYMEPEVLEMDEVVVVAYEKKAVKRATGKKTSANPPGSVSRTKYKKQILDQLDYTKLSDFSGVHIIEVSFEVGSDGHLSNFNFRNVPHIVFGNEIKKTVLDLGDWMPAKEYNAYISTRVELTLEIEVK